ncbi:Glycosyl transferase family 2 [Pedobacter steynii]|uniref:Glycosyl transferase family 2 n=1 Tax=Pedobacter steynii TaxID=430522 RepID=A0A1G9RVK0_9SPHI|nr:glycosyltransferase [Pedobacter steynii]NQX37631.1 glycosyltransferase [Pedobacter steynii]SDM27192.1 Glycosyl transferase family 2 [Pedobacter steynii]
MNKQNPLISCICITRERPLFLQRTIACFMRQEYQNRELVISYPDNDLPTKNLLDHMEKIFANKFLRIERPVFETLGMARNKAIELAKGEFICIWDDDDFHNSHRLSHQYNVIKDGPFKASILANVLIYDAEGKETYYSCQRGWEGSLLCEKEILLKKKYLDSNKNEWNALLFFLSSGNVLYYITEMPHLYVYVYHSDNTMASSLFEHFLLQSIPIEENDNKSIQKSISLDQYLKTDL